MNPPTIEELTVETVIYPICPKCLADLKDGKCPFCDY